MSDLVAPPSAADLSGALAEPERLSVFAALALGAGTELEISASTGLSGRAIEAALRRLRGCGLVSGSERLTLHAEMFKHAARQAAAGQPDEFAGLAEAETLRLFVRRGRLLDMPADEDRRRIVLRYIAESCFAAGTRYAEPEVNDRLEPWRSDWATLRRYMIDLGVLHRSHGQYWLG